MSEWTPLVTLDVTASLFAAGSIAARRWLAHPDGPSQVTFWAHFSPHGVRGAGLYDALPAQGRRAAQPRVQGCVLSGLYPEATYLPGGEAGLGQRALAWALSSLRQSTVLGSSSRAGARSVAMPTATLDRVDGLPGRGSAGARLSGRASGGR